MFKSWWRPCTPFRPLQAYWPFHRLQCKRNEFADAMEEADPKFAGWMRQHGKMAVLKDDEVDRLERAAQAAAGPSREEVMSSMYGRLDPRPAAPSYSAEELRRLEEAEEARRLEARTATPAARALAALDVPRELGARCADYTWRQSQTHVEVFVPLRPGTTRAAIEVELTPARLRVQVDGRPAVDGQLWREVKAEESTWFVQDDVLEIVLLKRHRRGNYADGETNATTFWYALVRNGPPEAALALEHPPAAYYRLPLDEKEARAPAPRRPRRLGARAAAAMLTAAG